MEDIYRQEEYKRYQIKWYYNEAPDNPRNWDNVAKMICWHSRYDLGDDHNYTKPDEFFANLVIQFVPTEELEKFLLEHKGDCWIEKNENEDEYDYIVHDGNDSNYDYTCDDLEKCVDKIVDDYDVLSRADYQKLLEPYVKIVTLSLYDHSGITMWIGDPNDRWDSSYVGYIYISKEEAIKQLGATEENWREKAYGCMEGETEEYDLYLRGEVYGFVIENPKGEGIDSCWGYYGSKAVDEQMSECKSIIDGDIEEKEKKNAELKKSVAEKIYVIPYHRMFFYNSLLYRKEEESHFTVAKIVNGVVDNFTIPIYINELPEEVLEIISCEIKLN